MRRIVLLLLGGIAVLTMGACPNPSNTTTVLLVNNADFPVTVRMFYSEDQYVLESVLERLGREIEFTVESGSTASFSRDCDELQAVFIKKAKLVLLGDVGPTASTRVYRDGSDFGCGDTATFTFTQAPLATGLNIAFSR